MKLDNFFRMGPRQTYLTTEEDKRTTYGTDLKMNKRRISILMCANSDGTHDLPVSFIDTAPKSNCFSDPIFAGLKQKNFSQSNACMVNKGFMYWIQNCYEKVHGCC